MYINIYILSNICIIFAVRYMRKPNYLILFYLINMYLQKEGGPLLEVALVPAEEEEAGVLLPPPPSRRNRWHRMRIVIQRW